MFDFIRRLLDRLLGGRGTMPATADSPPQDTAEEPWLASQDRDAAAALAAAGYAAAPETPAAPAGGKRYAPVRGEYDRRPPEPQAKPPQPGLRLPPSNPAG